MSLFYDTEAPRAFRRLSCPEVSFEGLASFVIIRRVTDETSATTAPAVIVHIATPRVTPATLSPSLGGRNDGMNVIVRIQTDVSPATRAVYLFRAIATSLQVIEKRRSCYCPSVPQCLGVPISDVPAQPGACGTPSSYP